MYLHPVTDPVYYWPALVWFLCQTSLYYHTFLYL